MLNVEDIGMHLGAGWPLVDSLQERHPGWCGRLPGSR